MAERLLIFFLMLKKVTVMKNRNYDPLYLPYGYIFKENSFVLLCVFCNGTFTNELMKPNTLKWQLNTSH